MKMREWLENNREEKSEKTINEVVKIKFNTFNKLNKFFSRSVYFIINILPLLIVFIVGINLFKRKEYNLSDNISSNIINNRFNEVVMLFLIIVPVLFVLFIVYELFVVRNFNNH